MTKNFVKKTCLNAIKRNNEHCWVSIEGKWSVTVIEVVIYGLVLMDRLCNRFITDATYSFKFQTWLHN